MSQASNTGTDCDWTSLKRVGGRLCLDFVNTVDRETQGYANEWLHQYSDLIIWGQQGQLLTPQQAQSLLDQAKQYPDLAQTIFAQSIALRETLYRIFSALSAQNAPQLQDLQWLNRAISETYSQLQLIFTDNGLTWGWINPNAMEQILWQVVRSAAELLTDPMLNRVRECAGNDCGWVFLDTSRNRSRRWCDMDECGNRAKARRHYERTKE